MRFVIIFILLALLCGSFVAFLLYLLETIEKRSKKIKVKTNKDPKSKVDTYIYKYQDSIDMENSLSVNQYGNQLLERCSEIADYMLSVTSATYHAEARDLFSHFINGKAVNFDTESFKKYHFISYYLKNRLSKQTLEIEKNINLYGDLLREFDKLIETAKKYTRKTNTDESGDFYEQHLQSNLNNSITLLEKKILKLKTNQVYHLQGVSQLKTILMVNHDVIMEIDNLNHSLIPILKNQKALESFNYKASDKLITDLNRLNTEY